MPYPIYWLLCPFCTYLLSLLCCIVLDSFHLCSSFQALYSAPAVSWPPPVPRGSWPYNRKDCTCTHTGRCLCTFDREGWEFDPEVKFQVWKVYLAIKSCPLLKIYDRVTCAKNYCSNAIKTLVCSIQSFCQEMKWASQTHFCARKYNHSCLAIVQARWLWK